MAAHSPTNVPLLLPPRFRVLRELSKNSGQGRIFVVLDQRVGEGIASQSRRRKLRVVKLCKTTDGSISEIARLRLAAEFLLLGSIENPNIVRVFEHVRDTQYGDYLVLAYYRHSNDLSEFLCRWSREGATARSRSLDTALEIIAGAAKGVCAAHQNRVIHRDVKPSNFLVVPRHSRLDVVLLDFGIGKTFAGEIPAVTRVGQLAPMTPHYAAPRKQPCRD
jgi:serine/threonine protein kinase